MTTSTGVRLRAWARRNILLLAATVAAITFVAFVVVATLRIADERQARLDAIEQLAVAQCEGINETNATVRFVLDGSIRGRPADGPAVSDAARSLMIDTYRRLPHTDCATGAKTYFDPPVPR